MQSSSQVQPASIDQQSQTKKQVVRGSDFLTTLSTSSDTAELERITVWKIVGPLEMKLHIESEAAHDKATSYEHINKCLVCQCELFEDDFEGKTIP